ncbi:BTB/POZ domain-containing protein [Platanthera zijinensis]|uniref:BTB/POZ domain-containing protein n=1 Tax=Platanthera zijinensis TaxID=2320716 RepID=A0AAP0G7T9_9ASPA
MNYHCASQQVWSTELPSDIIIEIGDISFNLHKFPLLNRSGLLKKMISKHQDEDGKDCILQLHDLPGGAKTFELVANFCYDVKIELNSQNVAALRCAAEQLCFSEDYFEGNLISQTENFLNNILGNWKDSMKVLKTCEDLLPLAEELHIVTRCINSLATQVCSDSNLFGWPMPARSSVMRSDGSIFWNGIPTVEKPKAVESDWWYEESSELSFPLYKRLIMAMESKGMKPENIAGSLMFYSKKYFRGLSRNSSFPDGTSLVNHPIVTASPSESEQAALLEEIVGLLPTQKGVNSTNFLLRLLQTAMILHASAACRDDLEKRIGAQLDEASLDDLLIPSFEYSVETLYDIDCIQRMLDHFMSTNQSAPAVSPSTVDEMQLMDTISSLMTPLTTVAKLVDGYLSEVAPDANLKFTKFRSLADLVPEYARPSNDGIYRAIDIYLKSHPWLTECEREQLCQLINCQKLSPEACTHAAQNERLPLRLVVQVLFFEQLRLRASVAGWFFVSENDDNANGDLILPKTPERISEITQEVSDVTQPTGTEEMRLRVAELEKECMSMKQEIQKLGKARSSWSSSICRRLNKLGLGSRSHNL